MSDYLKPLDHSFAATQLEAELKDLFISLYTQTLAPLADDINVYGVPHLGSFGLVERVVDQEGLTVLRQTTEARIRYLYKAWKHRNPQRGLHFLRLYLNAIFSGYAVVNQLWIPKANTYPEGTLTADEALYQGVPLTDCFLTSRVQVDLDTDIIPDRLIRSMRSVVAARILLEVRLGKFSQLGMGAALFATGAQIARMRGRLATAASMWDNFDFSYSNGIPPLFVFAYGAMPSTPARVVVSQFPLAIVDQSVTPFTDFVAIRGLNTNIQLFARLAVLDSNPATTGVGNALVNAVTDPTSYCINNTGANIVYIDGNGATITITPGQPITHAVGTANFKIRDFRNAAWQAAMVSACTAIMTSFNFTGIYLDGCYVPDIAAPGDVATLAAMNAALITTLNAIRASLPTVLFIGGEASKNAAAKGYPAPMAINGEVVQSTVAAPAFNRVFPEFMIRSYTAAITNAFMDFVAVSGDITQARIQTNAPPVFRALGFYGCAVPIGLNFPAEFAAISQAYYRRYPGIPTLLSIVGATAQVTMTFSGYPGKSKIINIQRSTNRRFSTAVVSAQINKPTKVAVLAGLTTGTLYFFRFNAVDAYGNASAWSVPISFVAL